MRCLQFLDESAKIELFFVALDSGFADVDADGWRDDDEAADVGLGSVCREDESIFVIDHDFPVRIFGGVELVEGIVLEKAILEAKCELGD